MSDTITIAVHVKIHLALSTSWSTIYFFVFAAVFAARSDKTFLLLTVEIVTRNTLRTRNF